MAAPVGNKFWMKRAKHGRNKLFSDPDILWEECVRYFNWNNKNPLMAAELIKYQGKSRLRRVPKMRVMTQGGLCIFLGISQDAWEDYRRDKDLGGIIKRVDDIIRTHKFEGAAAELLNANIIARDLGLSDKKEMTGPEGGPIETVVLNKEEYIKAREEMIKADDC